MVAAGFVTRVRGINHEEVDVQFDDKVVVARNINPNLRVGDYVILNGDLVIQRISEREALRRGGG